jgi:uncharacterized protein (DUF58 family)
MQNLQEIFNLEQFDHLEWVSKQVVEGFITGMHKSPYHGFSVEFAEHRLYNQGEATKHIDWKLFARTDKLFVKRYEEETNLRCMLVLDNSSSMLFPNHKKSKVNKRNFSIYSIAALAHLLRKQRDAVGLTLFSDSIDLQTDIKLSDSHARNLYGILNNQMNIEATELNKGTNAVEVLHQVAESVHKRSLVVVFTDLLYQSNTEDFFSALEHLKYNKHEVIVYHVADKAHEFELDFNNQPIKFVDLENGETIKMNPTQFRAEYKKRMTQKLEKIALKCQQYQIDFVEADIMHDFREVLIPFLVKRSTLY